MGLIQSPLGGDCMNQRGLEPMRKQQSVRFESDAMQWLLEKAAENRRSVAEIIRMIVADAMSNGWKGK